METDRVFSGSISTVYDHFLGPLIFAPYARDIAGRLSDLRAGRLLETAAGTGIVTRALAVNLPEAVVIDATDLNQAMVDYATGLLPSPRVAWRQADAQALPFPDAMFDAVVCQFGVMFFPDKQASAREAFRVVRHGGRYLFAVWESWTQMPNAPLGIAAKVVGEMLGRDPTSPLNPPYHDESTIRADLAAARFVNVEVERISLPVKAASAREAIITVHGSLIGNALEAAARVGWTKQRKRSTKPCVRSSVQERSLAPLTQCW